VLAEEVMLVDKAVTREVAPRKAKAKAVAVNFILFGSCYPPSGRGGSFWWRSTRKEVRKNAKRRPFMN
jgi:hypothetical protein